MNMIEVKTAELSGAALDWAVAMTGAVTVEQNGLDLDARGRPTVGGDMKIPYEPSKNWAQCGPLIDRYEITILPPRHMVNPVHGWGAQYYIVNDPKILRGDSPLIAACRAIVAAKLGDTVQIPAELLQ